MLSTAAIRISTCLRGRWSCTKFSHCDTIPCSDKYVNGRIKALATVSLGLEIQWQTILVEFAAPSVGNVYLNRRIMLPLLQPSVNSCSREYLFSYQFEYTPNSALRYPPW